MDQNKSQVKKLELKKKTISQLSAKNTGANGEASWSYYSIGCATDFTRTSISIIRTSH
jgi:hypothetical protein